MLLLEAEITVWPTPIHVKDLAYKVSLIESLDWIAEKMKSPRPKTVTLTRGDPIPDNVVLKRTHSDQNQHVRLPGKFNGWDELEEGSEGGVWFSQDYVDLLEKLGEWRVIMAGGEITYVIHTVYNTVEETWSYDIVDDYISLRSLR
jgi:hypothetical protein